MKHNITSTRKTPDPDEVSRRINEEYNRKKGKEKLEEKTTQKETPEETIEQKTPIIIPDKIPDEVVLLSYDGKHKDFFQELLRISNQTFARTKAEIPTHTTGKNPQPLTGEVKNMYILKRLALITTIANDQQLRDHKLWPATPLQSELLLQANQLPNPSNYWEDLALILYDTSDKGANSKEAKALHKSIEQHRSDLGLTKSALDERLLIVNAGLELDASTQYGVKLVVLPDITKVYAHETLKITEETSNFEYGLEYGLPSVAELGKGSRTLYMPSGNDIGLRVLFRYWGLGLCARYEGLVNSNSDGRVSFCPEGTR